MTTVSAEKCFISAYNPRADGGGRRGERVARKRRLAPRLHETTASPAAFDLSRSHLSEPATAAPIRADNFIFTFWGTRCKESAHGTYPANLARCRREIHKSSSPVYLYASLSNDFWRSIMVSVNDSPLWSH